MAELTYWTASLNYKSVVADEAADIDANPETKGVHAAVTITPFLRRNDREPIAGRIDAIIASTLVPPAMIVLAPVAARLDDGRLMLRAAPDRPIEPHANLAAFPATGDTAKLYRAADTGLLYEWNSTAYVLATDFAPVRLVAQTGVLDLAAGVILAYRFEFSSVTFNGGRQQLPAFVVDAPTAAGVVDVGMAPHVTA